MSILDGVMGQFGGQIESQVAGMIASKFGIDPAMAQTAIAALVNAHSAPTDTVQTAASETGMSPDILSQIVGHLGGEGALGQLAGAMGQGAPAAEGEAPAEGGLGGMLSGIVGSFMGGAKN